jgi:PAS domain S-box-containing protein
MAKNQKAQSKGGKKAAKRNGQQADSILVTKNDQVYNALIQASFDGFCVLDMEGRILDCNDILCQILGYSRAELLQMDMSEIDACETQDETVAHIYRVTQAGTDRFQTRHRRKDGSYIDVEISTHSVPSMGERCFVFIRDITEQKRFEEERSQTESLLHRSQKQANLGSFIWDLRDDTLKWSQNMYAIHGIDPNQFSGNLSQTSRQLIHPDDLGEVQSEIEKMIASRRVWKMQFRIIRPDGSERIMESDGEFEFDDQGIPIRCIGIHQDITERKEIEAAFLESQSRYQTFINATTDLVFLKDDQFRYLFVNDANAQFFGKSIDEVIGSDDFALMPENAALACRRSDEQVVNGNGLIVNLEEVNGRIYETRKFPVQLQAGRWGVGGYVRDVTLRKQMEEKLTESVEMMRYIVKHDPNALAVYDLDLRYLAVSDRYLQDYNVREEDILGKHHYEVFPEMPQRWKEVHQRCLAGAIERNDDDYFERPDGSITYNRWECRPWYRADGKIGGMITYTEVTTERKLAEKKLRESERKFSLAFLSSPYAISITRLADGILMDINESFCTITGYKKDEVIGKTALELGLWVNVDERAAVISDLQQGRPVTEREYLFRKKTGEIITGLFYAVIIDLQDETCILSSISDISERKRADEQIRASLAEKEVLLREIHHRVKNNLEVVLSLAEMQARRLDDARVRESLRQIQERIRTIALVHDSIYRSTDLTTIAAQNYLQKLVDHISEAFGSYGMQLSVDAGDVTLNIESAIPCGLIVTELVTNSIKYAFPERNPAELLAQESDVKHIRIRMAQQDQQVILQVSDNGVGLPANLDPMNTQSLGLRLVRALAGQLHGSVDIRTGPGTHFEITFPP